MQNKRSTFQHHLGLPSRTPMDISVERAKGIYLYGPGGKRYIDLVSGVSVSNTGHGHPDVLRAVRKQLDRYMHLMVYGEIIQSPQVHLAEKLTSLLPSCLDSVYFVNSGSEAIEGALKLAKRYTGRTEVVSFRNAYHGGTHGALSILGHERLKNAFRPLLPDIRQLRFNEPADLEQITTRTACVVAETIQAEAGIILPQEDYFKKLRLRCNETGTLLVTDDIQMGFGRTGRLFSFEHYGFVPDILCLAKAMGGGMPLGAFIAGRDIMDALTYDPSLGHITTFGGHPVSCAASLASLNIILKENLMENAEKAGHLFYESLHAHPMLKEIRRTGLMLGLELECPGKMSALNQLLPEHGLIADQFLFNPATFRIAPPLTITQEETGEAAALVWKCLDRI